jgi:hypothetical protein
MIRLLNTCYNIYVTGFLHYVPVCGLMYRYQGNHKVKQFLKFLKIFTMFFQAYCTNDFRGIFFAKKENFLQKHML